jgi:N-acetylmuramoyl-L-alanine amidase
VGQNGQVAKCVREEDTAFHAGHYRMNCQSVGIECEGACADPETWTDLLLDVLLQLCVDIVQRHGIIVSRLTIIGHNEVPDPRDPDKRGGIGHNVDPGSHFPWDRFMAALNARLNQGGVS